MAVIVAAGPGGDRSTDGGDIDPVEDGSVGFIAVDPLVAEGVGSAPSFDAADALVGIAGAPFGSS